MLVLVLPNNTFLIIFILKHSKSTDTKKLNTLAPKFPPTAKINDNSIRILSINDNNTSINVSYAKITFTFCKNLLFYKNSLNLKIIIIT